MKSTFFEAFPKALICWLRYFLMHPWRYTLGSPSIRPRLCFVITTKTSLCLSSCGICCNDCLTGKSKFVSAHVSSCGEPAFTSRRELCELSGSVGGGAAMNMVPRLRGSDVQKAADTQKVRLKWLPIVSQARRKWAVTAQKQFERNYAPDILRRAATLPENEGTGVMYSGCATNSRSHSAYHSNA